MRIDHSRYLDINLSVHAESMDIGNTTKSPMQADGIYQPFDFIYKFDIVALGHGSF